MPTPSPEVDLPSLPPNDRSRTATRIHKQINAITTIAYDLLVQKPAEPHDHYVQLRALLRTTLDDVTLMLNAMPKPKKPRAKPTTKKKSSPPKK